MNHSQVITDIHLSQEPVRISTWTPFPLGGAECSFLGVTRPDHHEDHGDLIALEYEAHEVMALSAMHALAEEATRRWSLLAVRSHHALGPVRIGEASVAIQVVCGHRPEAFEACRWLIDELKSQVPIWKKERWQDGSSWSEGTPLISMKRERN